MKKYLLIITFFIIACVSINKQTLDCEKFEIEIQEKLYNKPLASNNLKKQILNKLNLINKKTSNNSCKIVLNIKTEVHEFDDDISNIVNRENIKIYVNYEFFLNNNSKFKDKITIFYGRNILNQRYSDYKKTESIESNIIEYIANEIYKGVLINMQK